MNVIKNITVGHTERLRKPACQSGEYCPVLSFYRSYQCDIPHVRR